MHEVVQNVVKGGREYRVQLLSEDARLMTMGARGKTTRAEARRAVEIVRKDLATCWAERKKWHE